MTIPESQWTAQGSKHPRSSAIGSSTGRDPRSKSRLPQIGSPPWSLHQAWGTTVIQLEPEDVATNSYRSLSKARPRSLSPERHTSSSRSRSPPQQECPGTSQRGDRHPDPARLSERCQSGPGACSSIQETDDASFRYRRRARSVPITRRRLETRSVGTSHADAERSSTGEGANQQRFRGPSGSVLAGLVQHLGRSRVAGSNSTAATEQCWADVDQAMRDMARTLGTVLPVSERQSSQSQILHERQSSQSQILHERWSSQSQTAQPAGCQEESGSAEPIQNTCDAADADTAQALHVTDIARESSTSGPMWRRSTSRSGSSNSVPALSSLVAAQSLYFSWPGSNSSKGERPNDTTQRDRLRDSLRNVNARKCGYFLILYQCLRIAPGLVSQVWLELNVASTKNPAISCDSIGAMCQALSGHLPTERQQRQLAFFLDLEGNRKVSLRAVFALIPAICYACMKTDLGRLAPLQPHDLLVRVALHCSYLNQAPRRVFHAADVSRCGWLSHTRVASMLAAILHVSHVVAGKYASLLMQHDDFDGCHIDGRLREDPFCISIRRLQRKWEKANIHPVRDLKLPGPAG